MSYHQGAEGEAIPKERLRDGSPNKDLDETMDPDMRVHLERPVSPIPSYLSIKSDKSLMIPLGFKDGELAKIEGNNLNHLQLRTASHMSTSDQSDQSLNLSRDPSDDGDQTRDGSLIRPEEMVCDVCEVKAVKFCQTCTLSYCGTHVKKHYTVPKLQRHTLVEVTGDLEERLCQEHHRALEVFCRTDQKLICSLCSVTMHKGHDVVYEEIKQAGRQTFDRDQCQRLKLASVDEVLPPPGAIQFSSVTSESVSQSWGSPEGLTGPHHFRVTWRCDGEERSLMVEDGCNVEIVGLQPGKKYQFSVATEGGDGSQSRWVSSSVFTVLPAPDQLTVDSVDTTSAVVSWSQPPGLDQSQHHYQISYHCPGTEPHITTTSSHSITLSDLQCGTQYSVTVCTVLENGTQSQLTSTTLTTILPAPDQLTVDSVDTTSATVSWSQPPGLDQTQHHYQISYRCPGTEPHIITTSSHSITLSDLQGATEYSVTVCTVLDNGEQSQLVLITLTTTILPAPDQLTVDSVDTTSAAVSWSQPPGFDQTQHHYQISYHCPGTEPHITTTSSPSITLSDLQGGTQYSVTVCTVLENGKQSPLMSNALITVIPAPDQLTVDSVDTTSAAVSWNQPPGLDQTQHHYQISYHCPGTEPHITTTSSHSITLSDLQCGTQYSVTLCTVLENEKQSQLVSTTFTTILPAPDQLTVDSVETTSAAVSWSQPPGLEQTQHHYQISYQCPGTEPHITTTSSHSITLSDLQCGTQYSVTVCTVLENGKKSQLESTTLTTVLPAPDQLTVDSVDTTSATISWNQPPGLEQTQHHYQISYHCPGTEPHITTTSSPSITLSDLQRGTQYSVTVCTVLEHGKRSEFLSTTLTTVIPAPDQLTVDSVDTTSAAVSWNQPPGLDQTQHHYQISYHCPGTEPHITTTSSHSITLSDLQRGTQYSVTVCTVLENGRHSQLLLTNLTTDSPWHSMKWIKSAFHIPGRKSVLPAPDQLTVNSVETTSAAVSWNQPPGLDQTQHHYQISYHCPGTEPHITTTSSHSITLSDLQCVTQYSVTVCTVLGNGKQSQLVSTTFTTILPAPDQLTVDSVDTTSAAVSWNQPPGLDQTQHHYQISYHCPGTEPHITTTSSPSITLSDLQCVTQYSVTVCTVLENGNQSERVSRTLTTILPAPVQLTVDWVSITSAAVSWSQPPGLDQSQHHYQISYHCPGTEPHITTTSSHSITLSDLRRDTEYSVTVCTVLENGKQSQLVSTTLTTILPAPDQLTVDWVSITSAAVSWNQPPGLDQTQHHYHISYRCPGTEPHITTTSSHSITLSDLRRDTEYSVTVCTMLENRKQSQLVSTTLTTVLPVPDQLTVDSVDTTLAAVSWNQPPGLDQTQHHYQISYHCPGTEPHITTTSSHSITLSDLQRGTKYSVTVCTVLEDGKQSQLVSTILTTGPFLRELLSKTGLEDHYENKLTLSSVLEINADTTSDEPLTTMQSLPGAFLKKLMMANVNARSVKCLTTDQEVSYCDVDNLDTDTDCSNVINPLDLITALFLCSDGFLQQEMVQKMSMCQFAVPLLLPNCDTEQSTLMLWALRDIVRKFRPSSQTATNAFVEERIVVSDIPMVSFVRIGKSSLSKSQISNKLLSNPQQYHDTFVHDDVECGDVPRQVSDGLVEISWYFPCGNRNIDMFTKPVAVANLRGDIKSFETQFSFLCQTSAAVYIFIDDFEADLKVLAGKITKTELFLVVNSQNKTFRVDTLKKMITNYSINPTNVIVKKKQNDVEFVKTLQSSVGDIIEKSKNRLTIENMATVARQSKILVDEDSDECQSARKMADEITSNIKDTIKFKDKQLQLQGQIWKELSQLEKERCRLRKAGEQNIEHYKSSLKKKEEELRKKQYTCDMSDAMASFILGLSGSGAERSYFLKWMRINLDNLSRQNLSALRDQYKNLCQHSPERKDDIKHLDKQLSDCSLGLEHFLRELGQLYEASCSLPENILQRKQMEHLPGLCAQMLLDGFPVELVDGDASNIPLKWISAVLTQLNTLVDSNSKIRVVTVLGVQSTGKSTLLNTMFGVQFAVSSGRCTRGAFMLLIKVNKELKEELKCDFIMVIDTEGLKSPELAQLDDSHEHDNELATLVIGLSDVTIINIAMENSTEMKDILQIVVHAFIRMKEVGKKPICHFVHQNVSDMSAHDNNMRDRKKLLEQLNEMTQAAARMEKKENITKFTDVMEYDPDTSCCYIPGLWHGTPPMAPVNAGYSEAVYSFKKTLMKDFRKCQRNDDLTHFLNWTQTLWEAVKFEKFIFSFRNSLVADAYSRLCSEYNGWEWAFQKEMYKWMVSAETKISNIGMTDQYPQRSIRDVLQDLMREASGKLSLGEKEIHDNLVKYFEKEDGHVNLVEKYKEDFVSSAKTLRRETENTVRNKLQGAVEIKEGMTELDNIKSSQTSTMEKQVLALLQNCRQKESVLSDEALSEEFEIMWRNTLSEITFKGLPSRDVAQDTFLMLRDNLTTRGSHVNKMVVGTRLVDCGRKAFVLESASWWQPAKNIAKYDDPNYHRKKLQDLCDDIIRQCQEFITLRVKSKTDYHDTHIKELLRIVDKTLQQHTQVKVSEECEVSLKQHICGRAAREFQKMHDDFIEVNDPRKCLEKSKKKYLTEFIDLFHNRDQCQKKAGDFTKLCLEPAVQDYVTRLIGPDVIDEVKTGEGSEDYSTRVAFQFSMLKQLLTDGEYEKYREYINHYERFVKDWLFDQIVQRLSEENSLKKLEIKHLSEIVKIIIAAISNVSSEANVNDIKTFINNICDALSEKLVFPKDALDSIRRLIPEEANREQFAVYLTELVGEMEQSLAAEYNKGGDIKERLRSLPFKPQNEMFTSLFGCGEQCPFCKAPCEAGGKEHTKHFTSIHRSKGLSAWRCSETNVLVIDICSSLVISGRSFYISSTAKEPYPYKDYQTYYPDWIITGDSSKDTTDYWKYVMAKFHVCIAKDTSALPADIPEDWKALTPDDAMKSLKSSFNIKD
ncbi:interferon-induced very large GTPase 1-like isoform X2 [Salvelinus alpinus]|uniref:interferon-induced very large GTPase 1-like isoform X2 n=1 Tax=Salvelinus alpinus TaxID=8036 RepID=UPI0039FBA0A3